jgi:NAD(P)-dependent dehydrogenase (short-subunit alcohol dehydrogenase family)
MTERAASPTTGEPCVVLVTGAAGAIGSATVLAFLGGGFRVVGLDREESVETSRGELYRGYRADLRDEEAVVRVLDAASSFGPLGHVVGIAGGALPVEPATQDDPSRLSTSDFRASIDANLTTQYAMLHAALPWLRASTGDRSVAFTSSFNALAGWGMPAYSAAKAGLIGLMRALAPVLGAEGIRVNVVAPGTIRTPRTEAIWRHDPEHFPELERTTALGRLGMPEDVARSFVALATQLTHVTGQVLVVDGGQLVKRS